jgi:UDP-GlcNAc3NAcA epimerase
MASRDSNPLTSTVKWISIVGARPQFVKLAPLTRAIENYNRKGNRPCIDHRIVHTGQHYDYEVAEVFFQQMNIPKPNYDLEVGSGSHGVQLSRMLERLEPVLIEESPDWVIVYGDTNSTLAGALITARLKFPLAHVEAGCRSGSKEPEEQNRVVSDHLSQLLLAPCQNAVENLLGEGLGVNGDTRRRVLNVGDILYDALLENWALAAERAPRCLQAFGLQSGGYYLLTLHRAENTNDSNRLRAIIEAASQLDYPVLFPVHPRTREAMRREGVPPRGMLRTVPALGYLEMLALEKHARRILTDSGGVQKEAFYLGVPCLTLRDQTEWPETIALGANRIVRITVESIRAAATSNHWPDWSSFTPFGDGHTATRIIDELLAGVSEPQLEPDAAL